VTVTPASGQSGTATITVTVSDGSLSASDTFVLTVNANTAPTISDIAAQSITAGNNTGALAFTVGDAQTAAGSLSVSASSSNTGLVPNANIVFSGSGANRTVTVTPASNESGTATITVTVSDGSLSTSDTFVLTVNSAPANTAPTISDIATQTINEGGNTGALAFTIGDAQTAVGSLSVSGSSSNTTLVPNANIVFSGSGANRTVTVAPASGQSGTATITVTVSDGSLSASDTFVLTVNANTAPTISDIAGQTINQGSSTSALAFTVGDAQTAAGSLNVSGSSSNTTLVPNANIVFGGSGANRTVTVAPASGQSGTATITVTVSDGSLSASDTFVLTVNANTAPTISDIAAQTINEGNDTSALAFTVGDTQTAVGSLIVSGSSSNTTLAPNANIVFGGSGANRTVTVTPATGQSGTATITVTVSDGSLSTSDTFVLMVNANTAPTISDIADQTIIEGYSGDIYFTVGDEQTTASSLTLSLSINNTDLVTNDNIVFESSGENYKMMVFPASGQTGTATITVTVSDGSLSSSDTFSLSVIKSHAPPTISGIANKMITEGGQIGALAFTIGDDQTAAESLLLSGSSSNTTLVSNGNIVFGGSGANRTVTVTPANGQSGTATITVMVSDGSLSAINTFSLTVHSASAFVLIPKGAFTMGDSLDGMSDAPIRVVTLDAFYMGTCEVTKAEWDEVRTWGLSNGYTDLPVGSGKAGTHPVHSITWNMILKWCNARSEKEGLRPVYYTNDAQTTIYKKGSVNVTNEQVNWNANGYRLPTEAEWEKAARGGLSNKRFPWGDTISHSQANYFASSSYAYDLSRSVNNCHPTYATGDNPYTSPVGAFPANGYGLHDMAGNVWEFCWDWYGDYESGSQTNPRGSTSGTYRVYRGGSWISSGGDIHRCRVANRDFLIPPFKYGDVGFRVVRSWIPIAGNSAPTISDIAEQTITESSDTGAIAFTIGDAQTAAGSLSVSGSSSNTTLVPNANILFGGSGANRTVTVTPVSGRSGTATITVTVSDGSLSASDTHLLTVNSADGPGGPYYPPTPGVDDFALIPQGAFTMGDSLDSYSDAPTRTVTLNAFYMGKYEVTKAEWDEVRTWGLSNGYTDLAAGSGKASDHPVQSINWYMMVKWCNARSQKEGFTPVYYTNDAQTTIYKTGSVNVTNAQVKWSASGYRLPTEAEWEKAARGGLSGKRFPWGDTISHSQANYYAGNGYSYHLGNAGRYHPDYDDQIAPYTSPVGDLAANGYGLHDMAGNVLEFCWDWYGDYATGIQTNPRGLSSGNYRVTRGGSWIRTVEDCRVAGRDGEFPGNKSDDIGLRLVRSSAP
jgi:formylglycine-generating enzyme required for sulfatase activity